ncbi:hypothetical protein GIB67_015391 [Kingdonia uniflora]|uniref:Uncharacterized protein n=1 Tax=Kingdonia uniflora TaxID=39325 RepID=A0A7J7KYX9_9MAGN|nr:hypothetical protein GIB67_015391 [Kingdonia uniflora]
METSPNSMKSIQNLMDTLPNFTSIVPNSLVPTEYVSSTELIASSSCSGWEDFEIEEFFTHLRRCSITHSRHGRGAESGINVRSLIFFFGRVFFAYRRSSSEMIPNRRQQNTDSGIDYW